MTYFPPKCFSLIKQYAGINEAKFHQKKIAMMVNGQIECCRVKYGDRQECFPLVYHIQYLEEHIAEHNETIRSYGAITHPFYGGLALLIHSYDELVDEVNHLQCHLRWVLYL